MKNAGETPVYGLHSPERQRAAAFVELAIVLPFFVLLVIGTVEIGTAFLRYNTLTKLTFTAARYLSDQGVLGSTGVIVLRDDVQTEVKNLIVYGKTVAGSTPLLPGLTVSDVTLDAPASPADHVRVRVTYDYPLIFGDLLADLMPLSGSGFAASVPLSTSVVMRVP